MENKTNTHGGSRAGSGRKKMNEGEKKMYKNITISCTPEEFDQIKYLAFESEKTTSRYIIDEILPYTNDSKKKKV